MKRVDDFPCQELVEAVTDYLEGAMSPGDVARFEAHVADCTGCRSYVDQMRRVVEMGGRIRETTVDAVDPETRARLLQAFRTARSTD